MAEPAAPGRPAPAQNQNGGGDMTVKNIFGIVQKVVMFYFLSKIVTNYFAPPPQAPVAPPTGIPDQIHQTSPDPAAVPAAPQTAFPIWSLGTTLGLHVYITTSPNPYDVFTQESKRREEALPEFSWENIKYGDWDETRIWESEIHPPARALQNETAIWAQMFITANQSSPNPFSAQFDPSLVHPVTKLLTPLMKRRKIRKEKNLLSDTKSNNDEDDFEVDDGLNVPYWHQNLTLTLVSDAKPMGAAQLPPPLAEHVHLVPSSNPTAAFYYPVLFPNEFWHLQSHYNPLSPTNQSLPLRITLHPISQFKFQLFASMSHSFSQAAQQKGAATSELDEVKRMLIETNPILLIVTAIVSALHMVFEFLAFTSDVSHWRKKDELTGVSMRTIITNVFVQLVILLYLVDNNQDTSWMILFGQGTGMLIEAWKVTKVLNIEVKPALAGSVIPYRLEVTDKHVLSEDERKTQEYDKLAFRYVSYAAIPLLAGYSVYSLLYESHRGWYSYIISTLTSFVYMFGFAQLVPQLVINYKLKSVSHMPIKAMVYKTLGTVVDDFFAFCIKMPFLHRLACFRDDVVFLIFLYQRWIYRIDPNRANEYGQVLDDKQKEKVQKEEEAKGKLQDLGKATQKKVAAVVAPESKKNQ